MTRRGKIARLPADIRDQINSRLQDGEEGKSILAWLNSLPEVQIILADLFHGRPVNHANFSDWKLGGYRDWLLRQNALEFARNLQDKKSLQDQDKGQTSDAALDRWVAVQYAAAAKALVTEELDPKTKWARLRELCADFTLLHRAQLTAVRMAHADYWLSRKEIRDRDEILKHRKPKHRPHG
jgi:hypothetical protein